MLALRTIIGGIAIVAAATSVLVGCGDDDDDNADSPSAAALSGEPIEIGYINVENSPAGSYTDNRLGAEAAVEYINTELGGVAGHPIELESCVTNGTGESSIACANSFVQKRKAAVVAGVDFGADGSVPILERAGIPYIGGLPVQPAELTSPNAFSFNGAAPGVASALARYVGEDLRAKKASVLYLDVPAAVTAIDTYIKPVLAKLGTTEVTGVAEAATAADFSPALSKAAQGDPDAIIVLFGGQACSKIMQAGQQLNIDPATLIFSQNCSSADLLTAGGAGAEGARFTSPYLSPQADDDQVQTFRHALEEYSEDALLGTDAQTGFSSIMNLYGVLQKTGADNATPGAITATLRAAVDEPSFMGHPYTCDGNQVPGLPAPCDRHERILEYHNGRFQDVKGDWIDGVALVEGT